MPTLTKRPVSATVVIAVALVVGLSILLVRPAAATHGEGERPLLRLGSTTGEIGGWRTDADPTLASALGFFGEPDTMRSPSNEICVMRYNRLGLTMQFFNLGFAGEGLDACEVPDLSQIDSVG